MSTHWKDAVMIDLCDGQRSAKQIGQVVGLTRNAVTGRLQRLARRGLVMTTGAGNTRRYVATVEREPVDVDEMMDISDEPVRPPKLKQRACLTCGKPFMSAGPGNRMCDFHRRLAGNPDYSVTMQGWRF